MTYKRSASAGEQSSDAFCLFLQTNAASRAYQEQERSLALNEFSDEALLHAVACGGVWALEPLYQRYSRLLYAVAYHMVGDHQMTENLLQEVFVAVWRRATLYAPHLGSARNWLISIMRHRAIDYVRSTGHRATVKEVSWEQAERNERMLLPDVWEQAWRSLQSAELRAALLTIPQEQRLVIELAYFQQWTHAEIAERYHLPLGTVKGRIRLGLLNLKRAFVHGEEDAW